MKKLFSILIAIFIILHFSINIFALPDGNQLVAVKLNGKKLNFDVDPVIINGRTMVPMRAIFEELGSQVLWYPETRTVVGYKDNVFIKLSIGSSIAYKNGKAFPLDSPPVIMNGRTLVPVRFIAESFGIEVKWNERERVVDLNYNKSLDYEKIIDNVIYKTVDVRDFGIKIMIPEDWQPVDNTYHAFEYSEGKSKLQMSIKKIPFATPKTLDKFTEENKEEILKTHKSNVVFTGNSKIKANNIDVNVSYLRNTSAKPEVKQAIYYFVTPKAGFIITFSYYTESDDIQFLNTFTNIIKSLVVTDLSIVFENEHYIEYAAFFRLGMNLETEIYSNMDVENKLAFKGSFQNSQNIDHLVVYVSKGDEIMEQRIPVAGNKFDSTIDIPFGPGKHNITIGTPADENNVSEYIMQFSLINTSGESTRYLIPSSFVESRDEKIINLAKDITKEYLTDYYKARELCRWIGENIAYTYSENGLPIKGAKETLNAKAGNSGDIASLYAAFTRSIGIPSKIVAGIINDKFHVWNEVYINGNWAIVDPARIIGYFTATGEFVRELNMDFFNPPSHNYLKDVANITYLPF